MNDHEMVQALEERTRLQPKRVVRGGVEMDFECFLNDVLPAVPECPVFGK